MPLSINPGGATQQLIGTRTTDPAFGLPAVWIEERQRESAQMAGFTVVDCSTVVATHLSHLRQVNASKLLGRVETQALVEHLMKLAPKLIEDVIPKMVGIATVQKVLQLLLEEGVHIRDLRSIVECLAEHAATVTDPGELARRVRVHLAPAIVQQIYGPTRELDVIALEPELERLVAHRRSIRRTARCWTPAWPTRSRAAPPTRRASTKPGTAGLPPGAGPDPRAHGASAQARRAAAEGARPQRDPGHALHPDRLGHRHCLRLSRAASPARRRLRVAVVRKMRPGPILLPWGTLSAASSNG
jgi:hypothetical protein